MADSVLTVPVTPGHSNPDLQAPPSTVTAPAQPSLAPQPAAPSVEAGAVAPAAPTPQPVNDNEAMADAAVKSVIGERDTPSAAPNAMQASLASAVTTNPDAEAEARRVALRTGVPLQTVFAHPEEMKRKDALGQIDFDNFKALYPTTAGVLADVDVAKIAHDDIDNMGGQESVLRDIGTRSLSSQYLRASGNAGLHDLAGAGAGLLEAVNPWTTSEADLAVLFKDDPTKLAEMRAGPANFLNRYAQSQTAMAEQVMNSLPEDVQKQYGNLKYMTTNPGEAAYLSPTKVAADAVRSLPSTAALMVTTYLTRGAAATAEADALAAGATPLMARKAAIKAAGDTMAKVGAASEGAIGYAQQENQTRAQLDATPDATLKQSPRYQSLIREGFTPEAARVYLSADTAKQAGTSAGLVDAVTNLIGGKFLGEIIGEGGNIVKRTARGAATEGITETVQSAGEQVGSNEAIKTNIDPMQSLTEGVGENAAQGFFVGGLTGGVASGFISHTDAETKAKQVVQRQQEQHERALVAEQNAQDFEKMNALAAESKLKERDTLAFQNFIQQVAESDGAPENLYVDPRALAQSGINLEDLAAVSPSIADQVRTSLETGSDMQIPVSEYASHLAGTELGEAMIDHLKTDPLGMTRVESREFMQSHAEELKTAVEKAMTEHVNDDAFTQSANVLRSDLVGKLKETGRFTDDVNTQYATLLSEFYKVQAAKMGVTPEALFAQHPLTIQSTLDAGSTLDQNELAQKFYRGVSGSTGTNAARYGKGLYFTTTKKGAKVYAGTEGKVVEIPKDFLPKNPLAFKSADAFDNWLVQQYEGMGFKRVSEFNKAHPDMNEFIRSKGYDGVKIGSGKDVDYVTYDAPVFKQGESMARGSFNPDTNTITLLKRADLSTFLHEAGHFFLEVMNKLALDPNAPESVKADMQATMDWLGVKDLAEWNSHDLEWQREKHEQFARGFESYLFEGKSPSIEMRAVFQRFRAWLLNVYRSLKNLNVELTPEMRGVFDRMLATNEQIKETELARSYEPMFSDLRAAGMDPAEWQKYQELGIQATQDAQAILEARSLRDMKFLSNAKSRVLKDLQREAAGRRREVRDAVTKEVMAEPVNQARDFLKHGRINGEAVEDGTGTKLSIPEIEAMYGDNPIVGLIKDKLGRGKYGMLGIEKGMHPDQVAEMFGYTSGDELVRDLLGAESADEKIAAFTDQRMLEKYGDLTDPAVLSVAADEAIHNEVRARFVATELNALQKATGGKKILAEAARRFADDMISRLKVKDIRPSRYAAAEARAARAAAESFKAGGLAAAAVEKRNQLIQNYAARAAHDALAEADKAVRYFGKFAKPGTRENIDSDYLDQIDALLERFDLRKSTTLKEIAARKSLLDWQKAQEELGIEPEIPPEMLDAANRKSYKDMTIEELRGLRDTIKQIEHLGRLKNKLLTAKDDRDFKTTVAGIVASINEHGAHRTADNRSRPNVGDTGKRLFKGFVAQHRKVASLVKELDGFKDGGPMWETFVRTMNDAGTKEAVMRAAATKKLAELVAPVLDGGHMGGKGQFFESVGKSFNREERIGIALNTGNASNFQRLLDGEGWTKEQIAPILDTLTKADWDFVQNTWDFFESYRPEIGAKEKRVLGTQPKWIEPQPVHTQFGDYRGGYYPVKYDPRQSIQAEQHADAEGAKAQMKGAYTSATPRRSFTKTRADAVKGRPLLYSMDGLYQGTNEIIHDLSWHEWLIDANRLLKNKSLDGALRSHYGADVTKQFKTAVQDIAAGEMPNQGALDNVMNHVRSGASVAGLGLNIMNSVINMTGLAQSFERVGPKWMAMGVSEWAANPRDLTRRVTEKSEMMANRAQTMQREINEVQSVVRGKSSARQVMDQIMYLPMQLTQIAVDTPTWWGQYQKSLTQGHDEAKAVAMADQAVLDAQGGGQIKDLAAIQRGGAAQKLFTTFYSYFNTTFNLSAEAVRRTDFKDPNSVLRLGASYLMLYAIPAAMGTLIHSAVAGGKDDWKLKTLAKHLVNDQMGYLLGTMVGVREITGAAQTVAGVNQYNMGYSGPAGLRVIQSIFDLATQIHQGKADDALFKAVSNVLGIIFKLPAAQLNRTVLGTKALIEGKTENPAAIVAGPPAKK